MFQLIWFLWKATRFQKTSASSFTIWSRSQKESMWYRTLSEKKCRTMGNRWMRMNIDDGGSSQPASWETVVNIWEIALDCQRRGSPEPTWNSEVHSRLLRLALRGHWQSKGIWYQDITTARISDKSLVPSAAAVPIQSKLVDYVMIIDSSRVFQFRIIVKISTRPDFNLSINVTTAEWIRFNLIAVSIEIKRGAISQDEAFFQLSIWTAAHFAKLRQLMQHSCAVLFVLSVLFVQNHEWKLILAIMTSESRLEMHAYLSLGETGSLAGIYRVLATLRRLSKWIDEQYRPWFEDKILGAGEWKGTNFQEKDEGTLFLYWLRFLRLILHSQRSNKRSPRYLDDSYLCKKKRYK